MKSKYEQDEQDIRTLCDHLSDITKDLHLPPNVQNFVTLASDPDNLADSIEGGTVGGELPYLILRKGDFQIIALLSEVELQSLYKLCRYSLGMI